MDPSKRIKLLVNKANDFPFDLKIPVIRYTRSLKELQRMAVIYAQENENENAFILYMKLITLSVEKLPKHPQYNSLDPEQKIIINKNCVSALSAAEELKKKIMKLYQKDYQQFHENQQAEEKIRSDLQQKSTSQIVTSTTAISSPSSVSQSDESNGINKNHITLPSYSTVPKIQPSAPPPETDFLVDNTLHTISKNEFNSTIYKQINMQSGPNLPTQSAPSVNRSTKPLNMIFNDVKQSSIEEMLSFSDNKRFTIVPGDLSRRFLLLAASNTKRNIETCGILSGKLIQSKFKVTHLIIPKQNGSSDSCMTEKEEEMFDIQDKHDLITLGWIHTHPSQTCFLSSVDLHTQCSYQQLLPEAVAIVCSPKYDTIGMYRLTTHGLKIIANCTQNGFHPHIKEPPLFEESSTIKVDEFYEIIVVDLR